ATHFMRVDDKGVTFEVIVHFGTLLSVCIYFWKPLWRMVLSLVKFKDPEFAKERKWIVYLGFGTVPAVVAYLLFKDAFKDANENPVIISMLLCVTGLILFIPRFVRHLGKHEVRLPNALIMGCAQAFAILPGISRSGSTIVAGIASGTKSDEAAEFSFLLAIPAILGGFVTEIPNMRSADPALMTNYLVGGAVAFLSGLAAIYTVLTAIRKGKFEYFAYYCFALGILGFWYFKFGPGA
ncbi:MAG: undecaprenyl-diphosphate phosphatase, partial [Verrucomicrobiota bacterium]